MSWILQRDSKKTSNYRYIEFVATDILQDRELNGLQDMAKARNDAALSAIFQEGGLVNAKLSVSGLTVTLSPMDTSKSILVFFDGAFETLAPFTYTFSAGRSTGIDYIYLNWVLWRVTADGTHGGVTGCLVDPTLVDSSTSSPAAERGQLQLILSVLPDLSLETINPLTMLDKSTTPVALCSLTWLNGVITAALFDPINESLLATSQAGGFVRLTTDTSAGRAAAADDPRLSDTRIPTNGSVSQPQVSAPVQTIPATQTPINTPQYVTNLLNGGIGTAKLIYETIGARLQDFLDWTYTSVQALLTQAGALDSRVTSLENTKPPVLDLSFHVDQPLGIAGSNGTHPPIVNNTKSGFIHNGGGTSAPAYQVCGPDGSTLASLGQDGNLYLNAFTAAMPFSPNLFSLMTYVGGLQTRIAPIPGPQGPIGPQGPPGPQGPAGSTGSSGGSTPSPAGTPVGISNIRNFNAGSIQWCTFDIGSYSLGFGAGDVEASGTFQLPSGWNPIVLAASASLSVIQPHTGQVQVLPPLNGNLSVAINVNGVPQGSGSGWWASVFAFTISSAG